MEGSRAFDWLLKPIEAEIVREFVTQLLLPNSEKIRSMAAQGQIPMVFYQPTPDILELIGMGDSIRPMSKTQKKRLLALSDSRKWISKKLPRGMCKVFGVIHRRTFLFNWVSGYELYIEPGSLDVEWEKDEPKNAARS